MPATQQYVDIINTPVGYLGVQIDRNALAGLDFLGKQFLPTYPSTAEHQAAATGKTRLAIRQALECYFQNPNSLEQPATRLTGTVFQLTVWKILSSIAPGTTRTYGDIAAELASSARAVGNACRQNPLPIFIPCHRVVASTGRGGFMGQTSGEAIEIKEWLLAHEKSFNRA